MMAAAAAGWLVTRTALRRARRISFSDQVVLITGGSRGLGLVMARQLAAEGAHVAICARDRNELGYAAADLREHGAVDVLADVCDVTRPHEVREWIRSVYSRKGAVDVLINNAGVIQVGPLASMTVEDYEQALATHFWGPFTAIREALPLMRRGGRIVNIASVGGEVAVPHLAPYCASKFALVGLSRGLRQELARDGIFVTTVLPGLMRTGSPAQADFKGQHRLEYTVFAISDALPLVTMSAERAARLILNACREGRAELLLSLSTKAAVALGAVCPELTAEALTALNRVLPGAGGIGTRSAKGHESESAYAPSWLTQLSDAATRRNNELPLP
jgi:NAD(P)-dependent dehydrogenase (short-subunit alcohol dehydrogenase family)